MGLLICAYVVSKPSGGAKDAKDVEANQRVITGDAAAANRSPAIHPPRLLSHPSAVNQPPLGWPSTTT